MNLKRYNGEFYIMEYEETEEKNLKLFVDVLNKNYQEIINFFNLKKLEKKSYFPLVFLIFVTYTKPYMFITLYCIYVH